MEIILRQCFKGKELSGFGGSGAIPCFRGYVEPWCGCYLGLRSRCFVRCFVAGNEGILILSSGMYVIGAQR